MDKKTRSMLLGACFRLALGAAAVIASVSKISGGESVSRWIVMILFGALLIFWAGLDFVTAGRRIRAGKAAAARAAAAQSAKSAKPAKKR